MNQIKIFKGIESELAQMEEEVNTWLAEHDVRVVQVFGNLAPQTVQPRAQSGGLSKTDFAPSDVVLVVLYDK